MASSSPNRGQVFDEIRGQWVAATPEEMVRQRLLKKMVNDLGFPKELLCVEKDLRSLPHLVKESFLPDRRADIICFAKGIAIRYPLYPLLLIECKESTLTQEVVEQVVGYNHYVRAPFVAIANESELKLGFYDESSKSYRFLSHLPTFQQLLSSVSHVSRT